MTCHTGHDTCLECEGPAPHELLCQQCDVLEYGAEPSDETLWETLSEN